ncbi:hypothetical protein DH2020_030599 [Rehmannia glutinosa]|uniref:Uncharacterized protein n=1 Tax=Rehmannia glutinosa TaxID=99300 RepID=A0ABR0VKC3_REHGL
MSTIRFMVPMAIPNKPITKNHFIIDRNTSKLNSFINVSSDPTGGLRRRCSLLQCKAQISSCDQTTRRSGDYNYAIWDFDSVKSLSSKYKEEKYSKRACELICQVNMMLDHEEMDAVQQLEFIDDLQRLGISYKFEDKINQILNRIYDEDYFKNYQRDNLYSTALGFRLLRQHGLSVSQDVFDIFKNEMGEFKPCLGDDTKGLLELYEASFVLTQGEKTLDLAREFATNLLEKKVNIGIEDEHFSLLVHSALEIPLHWRIPRLHARWCIDAYGMRQDMNPIVLELAKLDFNIVQASQLEELKHVLSWWKQTRLPEKLSFARVMVVEYYVMPISELFEPQYEFARIMITKVNAFITFVDDIFDVYGTLEELRVFNDVIQRWDIEAMDKLPHYMQICFLALNNFVNEMAYDEELRRGDIPKSIQCYMNDTGASREEAREYIRSLMYETWKKMNEERFADSPFQADFVRFAVYIGRMAEYWYSKHENRRGIQFAHTREYIKKFLFEPIP